MTRLMHYSLDCEHAAEVVADYADGHEAEALRAWESACSRDHGSSSVYYLSGGED